MYKYHGASPYLLTHPASEIILSLQCVECSTTLPPRLHHPPREDVVTRT